MEMLSRFPVYAVLPSSDLGRARHWYEEKMGMLPAKEEPGGLWYECADGTWFVIAMSSFAGTAQNTAASFQVVAIESVIDDLRQRGVVFEEYDLPGMKTEQGLFASGPYKAAWFKDSDGNIVEMSEVSDIE
jgi:catechol 2,3-dioxygenase-like lactoylglutathione lyase family enzyme